MSSPTPGWNPFNRFQIRTKLTVLFILAGLIPLAVVGLLAYNRAASSLQTEAENKLAAVGQLKTREAVGWFQERVLDLELLAQFPTTQQAVRDFSRVFPLGVDSPQYEALQQQWTPLFTAYNVDKGYYDLFLISLDGDVVYSVTHEDDFGTSMVDGRYASSGLGAVSRAALEGNFLITDIESYAPSAGIPASFIGEPIRDTSGGIIGALVLQLPLDQINAIMQVRTGLGDSGETYIVGQDYLMRSDSRFSEESTILALTANHEPVLRALRGESGVMTSPDYRGIPVRSVYSPLEIYGLHWAILSEIDEAEIAAPTVALRNMIVVVAAITTLALGVAALTLARTLANPVTQVRDALVAVSTGDLTRSVHVASRDEIGDMARAYGDMQQYLREAATAADKIAHGNLDTSVAPRSRKDALGNAFADMQRYLNEMAAHATRIAEGELNTSLTPRSEKDTLGNAFAGMQAYLNEMVRYAGRIADGDLTVSIRGRSQHDELANAFTTMVRNLHQGSEQILGAVASVLIGVQQDGTVNLWNHAAERLFHAARTEAHGIPFATTPLGSRSQQELLTAVQHCLETGEKQRLDRVGFRDVDDQQRFLAVTVTAVTDADGKQTGALISVTDITEQLALEGQLNQAQKLEAIGQLAAGIAHEINTPIQFVSDNTRFLRDAFADLRPLHESHARLLGAAEESDVISDELVAQARSAIEQSDISYLEEEIPGALDQNLEGVERVATIVRAMKEFSHPGTGEKQPTDLNRALESTATVARNEWKYTADLQFELAEDLPPLPCFAGELNQVFLNLITNAAHAIEEKTDGHSMGVISIKTALVAGSAEIRIADTGGGVPLEIRGRIFDPFFTTKGVGRGTGQGLAIARTVIVDKHGGTLSLESELGEGSTFIIRLPYRDTASEVA